MFYSHEILTSRQYGVATVWLVATTSNKSSTRRVTRKSIQEVDVQRACGKILEPGAPIALRLQGSLLYGVSRVHNQQYTYLAADAKKIRDQMQFFFSALSAHQIDPAAGAAKRESNLVEDDPAFDPDMPLPEFDLDTLVVNASRSQKTSSQMSPPSSQMFSSQSSRQGFAIQLDVGRSSSSPRGYPAPFGLEGLSSAQKPDDQPLVFPQDDDIFGPQEDWGLDIDESGNVVESIEPMVLDDEPQLPPLPPRDMELDVPPDVVQFYEQLDSGVQGDAATQQEPPARQQDTQMQDGGRSARQATIRRKRRLRIDEEIQLSRLVLKDWQENYLEKCGPRSTISTSAARARRNAMLLTFGLGLGNIGQGCSAPGLIHPLALDFSGDTLFTAVTGIKVEKRRHKRRTLSEAIEDDEQDEHRRVRPRLIEGEVEQEQARAAHTIEFVNPNDLRTHEAPPEIGREAEQPMSDHISSTLLPWNRGSSAIPGSSARSRRAHQQGRILSSPLGRRGNVHDIVHYSDDAPVGGIGSDGDFGGAFDPISSSFDGMQVPNAGEGYVIGAEPTAEEIKAQTDHIHSQLNSESQRFVGFMHSAVSQDGERRKDIDFEMGRKWLAFNDLFTPQNTHRSAAVQAFYHTLCFATRGEMYVEQDDADQRPFGTIWIGVAPTVG